jgi:hypothetical protein
MTAVPISLACLAGSGGMILLLYQIARTVAHHTKTTRPPWE